MLNRDQYKKVENGLNRRLNQKIDLNKNPGKSQEMLIEIFIEYRTIIVLS